MQRGITKSSRASIAKSAGVELLDLMRLLGDYGVAAPTKLPSLEVASGLP